MRALVLSSCALALACGGVQSASTSTEPQRSERMTFDDDLAFLRSHTPDLVVLSRGEARVAVAPGYQGRVMTSSARGDGGTSCGWIHRTAIASGERAPHMNAFGGEDRFWLGPEGGQFGLYFPPGAPFDFEHWQVPAPIDWDAWDVVSRSDEEVAFHRSMELVNASGTAFSIQVDRRVRLLGDDEIATMLGAREGVAVVGYESINTITNVGDAAWSRDTGLVSIWILSMYPPSPEAVAVLPFRQDASGPIVNDAYFGEVPHDRLVVDETAGVLYFRADGLRRSKIGVPFARARPVMGSWDPARGVLTIVRYSLPTELGNGYVNSMWEQQREPFGGDVVNSYNDGPATPGAAPMGPFYELESSSPAAALAPSEQLTHTHTTLHVEGPRAALDDIAVATLGVGLDAIEHALTR